VVGAAWGVLVRANRRFHLIASRDGLGPAFLAEEGRVDRVEVVSIDDGEVVLFWQRPPREASRLLRELRTDLVAMDADAFLRKWEHRTE
jgi:hypothetical protein